MLNFCDFIPVYVFTTNHQLNLPLNAKIRNNVVRTLKHHAVSTVMLFFSACGMTFHRRWALFLPLKKHTIMPRSQSKISTSVILSRC